MAKSINTGIDHLGWITEGEWFFVDPSIPKESPIYLSLYMAFKERLKFDLSIDGDHNIIFISKILMHKVSDLTGSYELKALNIAGDPILFWNGTTSNGTVTTTKQNERLIYWLIRDSERYNKRPATKASLKRQW
jgi:hypothetical protein